MGDLPRRPDAAGAAGQRLGLAADHLADALEVPGVLFCNRLQAGSLSLVDLAPSILAEFDLPTPLSMVGQDIFRTWRTTYEG
ncbi:MAG: hypothetical protein U0797_04970 [Gemmataceae bacterium]